MLRSFWQKSVKDRLDKYAAGWYAKGKEAFWGGTTMNLKKTAVLLAALLLLAGCRALPGQESEEEASSSEESFAISHTSSQTVFPLPQESSEESIEEISLPVTPDPVELEGILRFTFPEGWENGAEAGLFAKSPDGNASVQGDFTSMDSMQGLTGEMLASSAAEKLKQAWEGQGITGVSADLTEVTLGGRICSAVALQGVLDGSAVFQYQAYLLTESGFLTVTITSFREDKRNDLTACFSGV